MNKFFTRLFLITLAVVSIHSLQAQDIHWSQFYSAPVSLNPASTGSLNGSYRASANFRTQYTSLPVPYTTFGVSFDMPILRGRIGNDYVGIGLYFMNDQSGNGEINNITGMGSVAYHKSLDRWNNYMISVGLQGGFVEKSLDFTKLVFQNQFSDNDFNPAIANGEPIQDNLMRYFDFNGGLLFTGRFTETISAYAGGSYFHFSEPVESFLGSSNTLDARILSHAGAQFFVNKYFSINPSGLFMMQGGATNIVFGSAFGYHIYNRSGSRNSAAVYAGSWYRLNDAVIIMGGIDYMNFRFGLSYDLTVSSLNFYNSGQGGFELAMTYIGKMNSPNQKYPLLYCPRF